MSEPGDCCRVAGGSRAQSFALAKAGRGDRLEVGTAWPGWLATEGGEPDQPGSSSSETAGVLRGQGPLRVWPEDEGACSRGPRPEALRYAPKPSGLGLPKAVVPAQRAMGGRKSRTGSSDRGGPGGLPPGRSNRRFVRLKAWGPGAKPLVGTVRHARSNKRPSEHEGRILKQR